MHYCTVGVLCGEGRVLFKIMLDTEDKEVHKEEEDLYLFQTRESEKEDAKRRRRDLNNKLLEAVGFHSHSNQLDNIICVI